MSHLPAKTTLHENYSSVYVLRFVVAFGLEKDFPFSLFTCELLSLFLSFATNRTQKVFDFDWRNIKYHVSFIERFIANFKSDLENCQKFFSFFDCTVLLYLIINAFTHFLVLIGRYNNGDEDEQ